MFKPQNKNTVIDIYKKSNEQVIDWFDNKHPKYKSKLFIINLDRKDHNQMCIDLCKFLDFKLTNDNINEILNSKDEFPRSNSSKEFQKGVNVVVFNSFRPWINLFVTVIVSFIAIVLFYYSQQWWFVWCYLLVVLSIASFINDLYFSNFNVSSFVKLTFLTFVFLHLIIDNWLLLFLVYLFHWLLIVLLVWYKRE